MHRRRRKRARRVGRSGNDDAGHLRGAAAKTVAKGESFWSDAVDFYLPPGHYLAFTWTGRKTNRRRRHSPSLREPILLFYQIGTIRFAGVKFGIFPHRGLCRCANAIAYKKPVKKIIGILGNSITQGFNVSMDSYAFWVAQAATDLGPDYGVWNLGQRLGAGQRRGHQQGLARQGQMLRRRGYLPGRQRSSKRRHLRPGARLYYHRRQFPVQLSPAKKIILCTGPRRLTLRARPKPTGGPLIPPSARILRRRLPVPTWRPFSAKALPTTIWPIPPMETGTRTIAAANSWARRSPIFT